MHAPRNHRDFAGFRLGPSTLSTLVGYLELPMRFLVERETC
jgi:hypothetical protein